MRKQADSTLVSSITLMGGLVMCAVIVSVLSVWLLPSTEASFAERLSECRLRLQAHDAQGARSELLRLHAEHEEHVGVIEMLSEAELQRGDLAEAIEWLRRVPESSREQAALARFRAAQLAMQLGQARATEALAYEALRLNGDFAEPRRLLLRYYLILFQHRQLCEQSALLDAQGQLSVIDLMMRCVAHRAAWQDDDHVAWLEQCLREDPANAVVRAALARYYGLSDRHEEARRLLAGLPGGEAESWRIQLGLAEQEIIAGRFERALEFLQGFPAAANAESRVWLARGKVWSELGHPVAARTAYENAVTLDPYDPAASYALARIRAAQGAKPEADALYIRSQRQKELMAFMERVMLASNPASRPAEPIETTMRAAATTLAQLELVREANILARALGDHPFQTAQPAEPQRLAPVNLANLRTVPAPPLPSRTGKVADAEQLLSTKSPNGMVQFTDIADRIGLSFRYNTGRSPFRWVVETLGGGVGVLDYDLDGWDDLFLTQAGSLPVSANSGDLSDRLIRNLNGVQARDVTTEAKLFDHAYGQGCAVGDYDNDGFADLFVCNFGECLIFKNQGDGTFEDVTREAGVSGNQWSTSAAFSDVDRDGDLDLYVAHYLAVKFENLKPCTSQGEYVSCHPFDYDGTQDAFWENVGNGKFVDRTAERGLLASNGKGLGVVIADFNRLGRESIFVGNDTTANFLFQPDSPSTEPHFQEIGIASGVAVNGDGLPEATMGIAFGDVDHDGRFDLFVTSFQGETNTLYRALGDGEFVDATERAGLGESSRDRMGWGCQFLDADCNGDLDLFVTNGQLHAIPQLPHFYYNEGAGRFREMTAAAGAYFREPRLGRSVALIDWNRDLLMDLVVSYQEEKLSLLENQSAAGNRLMLQFIGLTSNRDAIGTIVRARTKNQTSWMYVTRSGGYFAANDPKLLIGCGTAQQIDELEVTWPDGTVDSWQNVPANQSYRIIEGTARLESRCGGLLSRTLHGSVTVGVSNNSTM